MTDFINSVAARVYRPAEDVRETLSAHGVQLYTPRSQAEPLRLKRIVFSGYKDPDSRPPSIPFEFEWQLRSGINVLGSQRNSAGKTSVLEICRWMLTGRDKHSSGGLDPRVRAMVRNVRLEFALGPDDVLIELDSSTSVAPGRMEIRGATRDFDAETMSTVVADLMLDRLRLPTMSQFTRAPRSSRGSTVEQSWPLYSGALVVGPTHLSAVLGSVDTEAANLLQMYMALPWFNTLQQARAALGAIRQDVGDRQRAAEAEQEARAAETARIEAELAAAEQALHTFPAEQDLLNDLRQGVDEATEANRLLMLLEQQLAAAQSDAAAAETVDTEAQHELVAVREHTQASTYFRALRPTACPRCDQPIGDERLTTEMAAHSCSVCTRTNDPVEDPTALPRAEAAAVETKQRVVAAVGRVERLTQRVQEAHRRRAQLQQNVQALSSRGDVAERQVRIVEVERLRGRLAERADAAARANASPDNDPDVQVLQAAVDVAGELARESAVGLFEELNDRIVSLGQRFGVSELTRTGLNRAAHLPAWKGETRYNFRQLSEGDRLRLKVAVVVALLETAEHHGLGHHPGLLLVDSPGAQEVGYAPLAEMLTALDSVATALDLQILVATARLEEAIEAVGQHRVHQPNPPDDPLW